MCRKRISKEEMDDIIRYELKKPIKRFIDYREDMLLGIMHYEEGEE